ncbi:hypothetical protein CDL12_25763 [Handroanthus impetiginosus]|uniref:Phytocyanin domain-containing protein n=1 Tax=Handroanthus impetiginosus TaxID=429701 RepID=A0A2G9G8W8_9LAMI|nr:hypothetical protein CDL12_25763 [Handroanthus impetiginosus]
MAKAMAFLLLLLLAPAAYAQKTHTVGDSSGWNTKVDYEKWARGQNFSIGDFLVFTYDSSHEVNEVNQTDYQNCNTDEEPIHRYSSSPTNISLSKAETYFICPRSNHCSDQGMKLTVTVSGGSTSPGGSKPSPPGTPETPPRPAGGATGILGDRTSLMVGISVVLGALLGLMG